MPRLPPVTTTRLFVKSKGIARSRTAISMRGV